MARFLLSKFQIKGISLLATEQVSPLPIRHEEFLAFEPSYNYSVELFHGKLSWWRNEWKFETCIAN